MKTAANNTRYAIFSPIYDQCLGWFYRKKIRKLIEAVNSCPGDRVLDVGVGTGLTLPFYTSSKKITAIDCAPAMLNLATKKIKKLSHLQVELLETKAENVLDTVHLFDQIVFCNMLSVTKNSKQLLNDYFTRISHGSSIFILNHFTPRKGLLRYVDIGFSSAGKLLGFKSYFPLCDLIDEAIMPYVEVKSLLLNGYWSIVHIRKTAVIDQT